MLAKIVAGAEPDRPACVLVVEDEILVRAVLAEELRAESLCVVEAANADEAWAYLQSGGQADLVFSDIQMPGSMDGFELARQIKDQFPDIKIILTSGNPSMRRKAGHSLFIAKPYSIDRAAAVPLETLGLR
jgi:CheY-like chemotaxis protein